MNQADIVRGVIVLVNLASIILIGTALYLKRNDVSLTAFLAVCAERDHLKTRVDALTNILVELRRDGFSVQKPATVREAPDEEAEGLRRAEAKFVMRAADLEFITKATRDIMQKTGVSEAQARTEAIRLRRAVTDEDAPV